MRNQLITVPACATHNNDLSELDERFRVYLQTSADDDVAREAFRDKTMRGLKKSQGLLRHLAASSQPASLNGEPTFAIPLSQSDHDTFFEKICRGIYYAHFQAPFRGKITSACSHFSSAAFDFTMLVGLYKDCEHEFVAGRTTDDRVFKYSFIRKFDSGKELFFLHARFYTTLTVFSWGVGEDYANGVKRQQRSKKLAVG